MTTNDTNDELASFANDCFGRKVFADNIVNLIQNQKDYESRVIAIKADFGLGKTFFAKELEKLMKEILDDPRDTIKLYPHYINIWKEDYTNEPLLALLYVFEKISNKHQNLWDKKLIKEVFEHGIIAGQVLCESFYPFGSLISRMIDKFNEIEKENIFANEIKIENFINSIKRVFDDMENKKVVIVIDEIDRCMPEYAIRFLETLKHFFDIKGLYFILMFNENYLQKSLQDRFDYIDFALWKDKFIDLEFDLSVFHSQEKFIKYLVETQYKFGGKMIDNMQMYITYNVPNHYILDSNNLFDGSWTTYINKFLNSLDIKLNNRQLNTLCFRINLAIEILKDEIAMPDCIICVILKDMFDSKMIGIKQGYNEIPFTYYDGSARQHILNLFCGGKNIVTSTNSVIFFNDNEILRGDNIRIETKENKNETFKINKKAAEFAILANKSI